jgi:hypothetical protein
MKHTLLPHTLAKKKKKEMKWRKYFNVCHSDLSFLPFSHRDQLMQFRMSMRESGAIRSTSTQLAEQKEWLRRFQDGHSAYPTASSNFRVNFSSSIGGYNGGGGGGPGSDSGGSVYP